jgi:lysyl-tRNA synthetase class 1
MNEEKIWADVVGEQLIARKEALGRKTLVFHGMWTPSGHFHIGNARSEVFTPFAVAHVVEQAGHKVKQHLIVDDFDPIKKIPTNINLHGKNEQEFIGYACSMAPSPEPGYESWAAYFTHNLHATFEEFGIPLKIISATEEYRKGLFNDIIIKVLNNSAEVIRIWTSIAGAKKTSKDIPVQAVCERCGRIGTTKVTGWDGEQINYRCSCGYADTMSPLNGNVKLQWRVHWVAHWVAYKVDFESGGKDHFSKGGSVDVARALMHQLFHGEPPIQIPTEFIQLKGKKMSGSIGNVVSLEEWLEIASPELFRFLNFAHRPQKAIELSLNDQSFILLMERFKRAERIYHGLEKAQSEKLTAKIARAYELALIKPKRKKRVVQLPFSSMVLLAQLFDPIKEGNELIARLKSAGLVPKDLSKQEQAELIEEARRAKTWVEKYAPEQFRVKLTEQPNEEACRLIRNMPSVRREMEAFLKDLEKTNDAEKIQLAGYKHAKASGNVKQFFKAFYLATIGKPQGPKVGTLVAGAGKKNIVNRIRWVLNRSF